MSDLIYRQDAISREFVEIEISHPKFTSKEHKGNPYYAIKYIENGEEYVGYGTYKPEVLSQYLKEYFMPSAKLEPKCKSCRYRNLEWYEEPCDSCTGGGESCHYKPEPERLTDDDFEAIRIHLNAYKEKLCNQRRWEEAEEYQRIIDRFMSFASAEPEIIRCKDCKWWGREDVFEDGSSVIVCKKGLSANPEGFCHYAEMREGEQDEND